MVISQELPIWIVSRILDYFSIITLHIKEGEIKKLLTALAQEYHGGFVM